MSEQLKKNERPLEKKFNINIKYEEVEKKMSEDFLELSKTIKVAGFRPGKVPISFVKKRYFDEVLKKVSEKLIQQEGNKTFEKKKYKLAGQPKVTLLSKMKENEDLRAEFIFEILPEIKIKDFKNISLEKFITKVEEKDVNKIIKKLFNENKQFNKPNKERPSKKGDRVLINYKGYLDDKLFEGGSANGQFIDLGSNNFLPEFDQNISNKKIKDEFSFFLKFPKDYHNKDLKEKKAKFEIKILDILEPSELKNEEELAKIAGAKDSKELRTKIKNELEKYSKDLTFSMLKDSVVKNLDKTYKFDLPFNLVDREYQMLMANNASKKNDKKDDKIKSETLKDQAKRKVKIGLIVSEIGIINNIIVTETEIENEIAKICMQYPGKEKEVVEHYKSNPSYMNALKGPIFENKVISHIIDNSSIKEKVVTSEDLNKKIMKMEENLK